MIAIVKAGRLHTNAMAELLNEIILKGGTTALTKPVSGHEFASRIALYPGRAAWHVAEGPDGTVLGFQWIEPSDDLPDEAAEIATFAKVGRTGLGIGTKLFEATKVSARNMGYRWINANIRADNTGGLAYYQSRGFETYGHKANVQISDSISVDKVLKRYDL